MAHSTDNIRLLRPIPESIPWYIRIGHNDHNMLESNLSAGDSRINRVVIDAAHLERHEGIIRALQTRQAELVLDTRVAVLATPSSGKNSVRKLPWWKEAKEVRPGRYHNAEIQVIAASIAKTTIDYGFTAVLAPTHYLGTDSEQWVDVDAALTHRLRQELDKLGGTAIRIYYPLLIPYAWLSIASRMRLLDGVLSTLPIDAVWLRVSHFKNDKSSAAVRNYIEGARILLSSDRPLIADHVGGLSGLAIVAFGAAGGIAHGIGVREGFLVKNWLNPQPSGGGTIIRAYNADTDMYIEQKTLGPVLDDPKIRATLVCTDKQCCPRGLKDMFSHSRNHVINARYHQLATLTQSTEMLRSDNFIRRALIPVGASLMKLDHALAGFPDLQKRVQKKRRFVDDLRSTLEDLVNRTSTEVRRSPIPRRAAFRQFAVVSQNNPRPNL